MTEQEWPASDDPAAMLRVLTGEAEGPHAGGVISDRKLRLFACACCRQVWGRLTDDAPCGRCGGKGGVPGNPTMANYTLTCPDCGGTGRISRSRRAVEVAERYADGATDAKELAAARDAAWVAAAGAAWVAAWAAARDAAAGAARDAAAGAAGARQAALLRDIAGNPFRPVALPWLRACPVSCLYDDLPGRVVGDSLTPPVCPYCRTPWRCPWLTPAVLSLARAAYEDRREDGTLDPFRLSLLADALEEAGCDSEPLLRHLRGEEPSIWCDDETGRPVKVDRMRWRPLRGPHVRGCWALDAVLWEGVSDDMPRLRAVPGRAGADRRGA